MAVFSTFLSFYLPLSLFLLSHLTLPSPVEGSANPNPSCPPSVCGELIDVGFLFTSFTDPGCRWHAINCDEDMKPTIKFEDGGRSYVVLEIRYGEKKIIIQDKGFYHHSKSNFSNFLYNFTVPTSPFLYFQLRTPNYTFVNCKGDHKLPYDDSYKDVRNYKGCEDSNLYSWSEHLPLLHDLSPLQLSHCSVTRFPLSDPHEQEDLFRQLDYGFELEWTLTEECSKCYENRGLCRHNSAGNFICSYTGKKKDKTRIIIIATGAIAGAVVIFLALIFFFFLRIRNKSRQSISSNLLPRSISSDPYSKSELEKGIHTQVFEYKELEGATNNFDPSKELGDGGFGTVYHGKLRDGRFVAVKRLYENNYKQVEQFKNEIDILSRLRHQNLVALYGCSSRHRRELLLVYEFIPNGTVADHLHGDRVQAGTLTWPIRMSIAIETADALAYLHKVEIIHRDVKTNNILLDNNFRVKVADFGLSRLFPFDVTHVSTAPQGTPGYVDPDYRRCYQLTDKSDVYSFGVVLIELISSMPAVDISRHRHEINLSSMAIGKIHNDALHELVDPTLGFDSDFSVRRMITSVAELAIRCLQDEKEARPSMEEVLEELRGIESEEYMVEKTEEVGTPVDETALLKKNLPPSPDTVAKAWESRSTTPNTSG